MMRRRKLGREPAPWWYAGRSAPPGGAPFPPDRQQAFKQLYRAGFADVWRRLGRLGVPLHSRADVAAEVFYQAWKSFADYDPKLGSGRAWLYTIARNIATHETGRAYQRREICAEMDELLDVRPSVADIYEEQQRRELLHAILSTLAPELRAVVTGKDIDGRSMSDIADDLGVPTSTAYKWLYRGREQIARQWQRRTGERRRGGLLLLPPWLLRHRHEHAPVSARRAVWKQFSAKVTLGDAGSPASTAVSASPAARDALLASRRVWPRWAPVPIAAGVGLLLSLGAPHAPHDAVMAYADAPATEVLPVAAGDAPIAQAPLAASAPALSMPVRAAPSNRSAPRPPPPRATPAFAELRTAGAARAALQEGDVAAALHLLATQDSDPASGDIAAERELIRIRALVAAGQTGEARRLATLFRRRWPRHPGLSDSPQTLSGPVNALGEARPESPVP